MELRAIERAALGTWGNHRGWEVMSMMADNAAIIFFSPTAWRETGDNPGSHVLGMPAVRFLVSKDVFRARTNSLIFLCCGLSSVFLSFFPPQSSFSASSVPTAGPLCPWHQIPRVSFSRAFSSGTQDLLKKHCTSLLDTFSKIMHDEVCRAVCIVLFPVTFLEAASQSLISLLSLWLTSCFCTIFLRKVQAHGNGDKRTIFFFSILHQFICRTLV